MDFDFKVGDRVIFTFAGHIVGNVTEVFITNNVSPPSYGVKVKFMPPYQYWNNTHIFPTDLKHHPKKIEDIL